MKNSKSLDRKDCVSVECLAEVFDYVGEGFLNEMAGARDERELTEASSKLDGVIATLYNLRHYQDGDIPSFKDENFSNFHIEEIVQRFEMQQVETLTERRKILDEVKYWGGWKAYERATHYLKTQKEKG